MNATMLLKLPEEILTNIFMNLSLQDIRNLILSCKALCHFITNDNVLWRSIALRPFHYDTNPRLVLRTQESKGFKWYNNYRSSYNWCNGLFKNKVILQHRINYMPWIKLHNSEALLITVGTKLHCYAVKGIPNCNKLLWKLEVPQVVRNDIRTNDISRFILNNDLLVCGNRDGSTAVYKMDNIRIQPQLIQHIYNCHNNGEVEVTSVELVGNNHKSYVVTASNDNSIIKFWCPNQENSYQQNSKNSMDITLDGDLGVRCLAVNGQSDKLAIGPKGNKSPMLSDINTGQLLLTNYNTKNKNQMIRDIHWHNENTIVYVTHSGVLQLVDIRNNEVVYTGKDPFQSSFYCVKTDGHRALIAGSSEYSRCVLYDFCYTNHVQMFFTQKRSSPVYSLDFNTSTLITAVDRGIAVLDFDILVSSTVPRDYSDIFKY